MTATFVHVVVRLEEVDGVYVFQDGDHAQRFASRYADAVVSEEVVISSADSPQFLADTLDKEDEHA